nr:carbamate kinase [uncultured Draconibacterium sp.]
MKKRAVVALGGNAILRGNEEGTIVQQEKNVTDTLENLMPLLRDGYELVLTHGNGPQVGNILMRNDAGEQLYDIAPMPLNICVADSQGGIGFMIERMMRNVLNKHGIDKNVISMVTLVEIDANDPAFQNPSKRIGKVYNKAEANRLAEQKGWDFKPTSKSKDGYRRVVPSPTPVDIVNKDIIRQLLENGNIVIAAGGGGIPVYFDEDNNLRTLDAVIDKDMASGMLATNIDADELYILTDIPFIYKNFGEETQQKLEFLNYSATLKHLENGTFAEGTMEPKIKACLTL